MTGWGGSVYPWTSPKVIGTIVAGIVAIIIFGVYGKQLCTTKLKLHHPDQD